VEAERSLTMLDETEDAFVVLDRSWRITYLNRAATRWLRSERADLLGFSLWRSYQGVAGSVLEAPLREAMTERESRQVELFDPFERRWLRVVIQPTEQGLLLHLRDITTERHGLWRQELDQERYRLLAETLPDIVWATDADGRCLYLSPRWYEFSGDDDRRLDPAGFLPAMHPKDRERLEKAWSAARLRLSSFQVECRLMSRSHDAYRWFLVRGAPVLRSASGGIAEWVGSASDIHDRKRSERAGQLQRIELKRLAHYDALTGLPNRSLFEERLEQAVLEATHANRPTTIMFIDLDGFKAVNDSYGHAAGDRVLEEVARRLSRVVREDDVLARLHGDEFAVLLPDLDDRGDAARIAHALIGSITRPLDIGGTLVTITASVGVCLFPADARDARALLRCADVAMYQAKAGGKNAVCFFSGDMRSPESDRARLAAHLAEAVERGEVTLRLQPEWDTRSGGIAAIEALLRWTSPALGTVPPARFVPLAEERNEFGRCLTWSFEAACLQLQRLTSARSRPLQLGYNVQASLLLHTDVLSKIGAALDAGRLDPARLELEVAASGPFDDMPRLRSLLDGVRERGVRVAIDRIDVTDTLLAPLVELPFDLIKLGPRLVARAARDERVLGGARALVSLAHAQGAEVVAVGVETDTQRRIMTEIGCTRLQGFLLCPPVEPDQALALVGRRVEAALF
jgi:diguanylate cyclase (GGDEF)-like protein/PAS domain S-box-containing protein